MRCTWPQSNSCAPKASPRCWRAMTRGFRRQPERSASSWSNSEAIEPVGTRSGRAYVPGPPSLRRARRSRPPHPALSPASGRAARGNGDNCKLIVPRNRTSLFVIRFARAPLRPSGGRGRDPRSGRVRWAVPRTGWSAPLTQPSPPGRRHTPRKSRRSASSGGSRDGIRYAG